MILTLRAGNARRFFFAESRRMLLRVSIVVARGAPMAWLNNVFDLSDPVHVQYLVALLKERHRHVFFHDHGRRSPADMAS